MDAPYRVLLVEDNAPMRAAVHSLLRDESSIHIVGEAAEGAAALRLAEELRPDIVLMDVHMPVMGGVEATRLLRQNAADRDRPIVIALSGSTDNAQEMLEAGAAAFIPKSHAHEIVELIHTTLAHKGVARPRGERE